MMQQLTRKYGRLMSPKQTFARPKTGVMLLKGYCATIMSICTLLNPFLKNTLRSRSAHYMEL